MFCPNCGKDCAEGKFCPECGHEVSSAIAEKSSEDLTSRIPLGKHKGVWCSLGLGTEGLTICKTFARKDKATYIPYTKLTKALLVRQHKAYEGDYLLFRWEGNRQLLIPEQKDMVLDDATICFMDSSFLYHVFCMLKCLAPATAVFSIENNFVDIPDLKNFAESFDLAACFEKYNPRRDVAVKHLKKEFGIKHKEASQYVDQYFDMRFEKLYANDSELAFRHLNRIIKRNLYVDATLGQYRAVTGCSNTTLHQESKQAKTESMEGEISEVQVLVNIEEILSQIPQEKFTSNYGTLTLKKDGLIVSNRSAKNIKSTFIPYGKLTKILLYRSYDFIDNAYLLFRWEGNKDKPIPSQTYMDMVQDDTTFPFLDDAVFYQAFSLLKLLAPSTAEFKITNSSAKVKRLKKLEKNIDLGIYFQKYNPCRDVAIRVLKKDYGIKKKMAKALVDDYFDAHCAALYSKDTRAIIRDLNMAIKKLTPIQIERSKCQTELIASGVIFCPKCYCTDFVTRRAHSGLYFYSSYFCSPVIRLIRSTLRLLLILSAPKEYVCLECKHVWQAEKR